MFVLRYTYDLNVDQLNVGHQIVISINNATLLGTGGLIGFTH